MQMLSSGLTKQLSKDIASTKLFQVDLLDASALAAIPDAKGKQSSLAVAAFTLSEITHPRKRARLVDSMWKSGAEVIVIIDRGTPSGFSIVAEARAQLLELAAASSRKGHVVAPVCYLTFDFQPPPL